MLRESDTLRREPLYALPKVQLPDAFLRRERLLPLSRMEGACVRFAYADPPYFGCCGLYQHHHPDGKCWDDLTTHVALIGRLETEFPDGWVMSASSPSLRHLLPICPEDVRVGAWVKPFASFKPNVNPAYAWEPVMWRGGRKRDRDVPTTRDWCSVGITLKKGLTGAKPFTFSYWIFDLLGMGPTDELVDLFPGSGLVTKAWDAWRKQGRLAV